MEAYSVLAKMPHYKAKKDKREQLKIKKMVVSVKGSEYQKPKLFYSKLFSNSYYNKIDLHF